MMLGRPPFLGGLLGGMGYEWFEFLITNFQHSNESCESVT